MQEPNKPLDIDELLNIVTALKSGQRVEVQEWGHLSPWVEIGYSHGSLVYLASQGDTRRRGEKVSFHKTDKWRTMPDQQVQVPLHLVEMASEAAHELETFRAELISDRQHRATFERAQKLLAVAADGLRNSMSVKP